MKKSKFTEAQIVFALKQSETGTPVKEVCRKMGIGEATYFNWKKKFGGLGVTELRRLRQLEDENAKLKQTVTDLSLDKQMLHDVLKKSSESAAVAQPGWGTHAGLQGFPTQGKQRDHDAPVSTLLCASPPGRQACQTAYQRYRASKGEVRILAYTGSAECIAPLLTGQVLSNSLSDLLFPANFLYRSYRIGYCKL